jgi:hypothetical protein
MVAISEVWQRPSHAIGNGHGSRNAAKPHRLKTNHTDPIVNRVRMQWLCRCRDLPATHSHAAASINGAVIWMGMEGNMSTNERCAMPECRKGRGRGTWGAKANAKKRLWLAHHGAADRPQRYPRVLGRRGPGDLAPGHWGVGVWARGWVILRGSGGPLNPVTRRAPGPNPLKSVAHNPIVGGHGLLNLRNPSIEELITGDSQHRIPRKTLRRLGSLQGALLVER